MKQRKTTNNVQCFASTGLLNYGCKAPNYFFTLNGTVLQLSPWKVDS